ncbi:hypothetical protein AVEN_238694-1 [Araneus ventricosus]|uniref:Peptidase S1 domain-containing protein n=1 Tax=Araneus ventricosus TaxID=182803 RepID=A0A4Y2BVW9_ARAVE|nr:hypothetical protein AVEN_238694-1 [Araneus ventricosus]
MEHAMATGCSASFILRSLPELRIQEWKTVYLKEHLDNQMLSIPRSCTGSELELKQAAVPIISLEQCRKWHKNFDVAPTMACAGHADGGHDSCDGDSGGPLVYSYDKNVWHLAGIVSTGGAICGDKEQPGIYTLVPCYVDWMENVINET